VISINQIKSSWNRFFFEPESPLPIALYRIFTGLLVLANSFLVYPDLLDFYGPRGIVLPSTALHLAGGTGLNIFTYLPRSEFSAILVFTICALSGLTLALGLGSRISAIIAFITFVSISHRNPILLNSGDSFMRIGLFFLIFSHAGDALSIDRLIRMARGKETGPPTPKAPWAMRLIQLQLAFVYLYAFVWKAMGPMWLSGTAVYYTSRLQEFWRFPVPYIFEHMWTMKLWAWSTLVIEFSLGALIWIKELRYMVLLGGVLLHAGIDYSMNIPLFGFIMVSAYITFVEPADLQRAWQKFTENINKFTGARSPIPVFYDGKCSFCKRSIRIAQSLDIFHRFIYHDMHSPKVQADYKDLDLDRGLREFMIKRDNTWLGGFRAFRFMSHSIPAFWLLIPFIYLPGAAAIGDRVYSKVADNRYCIIEPPAKTPEQTAKA
jgi:predicted DCC family thiol-disulfide oxidoreductase YuxK